MDTNPRNGNAVTGATLVLLGATVGGALGYLAFGWLAGQGFYALALPGVLLGVGAGWFASRQSLIFSMTCGLMALVLGIVAEWRYFPFIPDGSFEYFVTHLFELRPFTLLMIGLGGFGGFWFSWRPRHQRGGPASPSSTP